MQKKPNKTPDAPTLSPREWAVLRAVGWASFLTPVALFAVGYLMHRSGFAVPEEKYDTTLMHWVMYLLFAVGTVVFFFSDGMVDFVQKRVFRTGQQPTGVARAYLLYTVGAGAILDLISISAFVGFLICGNHIWLGLFVILQCGLQIKYLPTQKRLARILAR